MPKVRVYEIAKELDINSVRVIEKLREIGIPVKNHMGTLDEKEVGQIKEVFRKKPEMTEPPKPPARTAPPASQAPTAQRPPAEMQGRRPDQRPPGQPRPAGPSGQSTQQRPAGQGQRPPGQQRPMEQRPSGQRPMAERPPRPDQRPGEQQGQRPPRPAQRPGEQQGQRPPLPDQRPGETQGQRPPRPAQRPGEQQGQRPYGQRPMDQRSPDQRPPRPAPRPGEQQGQRPTGQRPMDQRPPRPGQRPGEATGQRPYGQRPPGQRPFGQRPTDQRSSDQRPPRPGQRPGEATGQRPTGQRPGQHPARPGQRPGEAQGQRTGSGPAKKPPGQRTYGAAGERRHPGQSPKQGGYKRQDISKPTHKSSPKSRQKSAPKPEPIPVQLVIEEDGIKTLRIGKGIQVKDLASRLDVPSADVIKLLMKRGLMVTLNQEIDFYTATQIAEGYGAIVEKADEIDILEQAFADDEDDNGIEKPRPPIVVVMGHVDHGKTSLLDCIRKSSVAAAEAGGITQHIGAYTVAAGGKQITFLDTPGHEAFTAMRMRGARVTDIAILVVAADDGVMPQTIEAINHAKAAEVEIIVAINKMDKPSANPDRVKQELTEHGILVEEWGGEVISCQVSALKGEGIDHLLEMILLVSEMKELKANPSRKARGTVIEALLDKTRGPIATVLVQSGTLRVGEPVVAGSTYGKVRAMMDDKGRKVKVAGPSMPVEILGLSEVPRAGDMFYTANSEKQARQVAESVVAQGREDMIKAAPKVSLNDLFNQIQAGNVKDLNVVIKADVQGSVEAVKNSLERLSNDEVRIRALHGGVGAITESDVMLASASNAIIIGFNVKPETNAKLVADTENVDIRLYRIIYHAIEDITAAMKGMLEPVYQEKVIGHAEIRQIFKASNVGNIAGSYVVDGKFTRNAKVRVFRDTAKIFEGELDTLKRFKDDVKEVASGYECGLLFHKFNDIKEGDKVEAYIMEEVPR